MQGTPRIAFVGAGSTVFLRNLIGDVLQRQALQSAHVALMDIDETRLEDAEILVGKMVATLGIDATVSSHLNQREALDGADFVIVAFQIGGFDPCTLNDFEVPKRHGLHQTIGDTLGIGGIMRGLRTVPHLWSLCDDMQELCPNAILLQYVNPMAINCWAMASRYPDLKFVGLCHSVQGTAAELARDLDIPPERIRFRCAGINHMAFYTELRENDGSETGRDLYPLLRKGYVAGDIPKPSSWNPRCPNHVRYEVMMHLGYFVTESSEHFSEYVPWFIKSGRPDLLETFEIPLDEYLVRCREQINTWQQESQKMRDAETIEIDPSHEYASDIINSVWTGNPTVIYGNVRNNGLIANLPPECCVEVPCLVDGNGLQPVKVEPLPPQLAALMRTNINVQELTVAALMEENRDHVYHAAMLDPHAAAELDLRQIRQLVDELIATHGDWMPTWLHGHS